ncbi:hypothetical protein CR513_21193, partial [Mucuna pruriens]
MPRVSSPWPYRSLLHQGTTTRHDTMAFLIIGHGHPRTFPKVKGQEYLQITHKVTSVEHPPGKRPSRSRQQSHSKRALATTRQSKRTMG